MKVALYIRVSTLEQAEEGYSIGEQKDKLRKYCDIKDWTITKEYVDPGRSGSNLNRPSMQQLIKDAPTGLFDAVLVYKLDRLSRSQKDTLFLIEDVFQKNNVHFISLSENFDTSTAFGKAMIGILSVFAQLEREQIKERMTMGRIGRAKSGKIMEFNNPPTGYEVDETGENYRIKPLQAEIVKRIYSMYLAGTSISKIVELLNQEGHIGSDVGWSFQRIKYILTNPTYTGKIRYAGKVYDGRFTPLIDEATFTKVQKEIKTRQTATYKRFNMKLRPFQSKYMLSGLLRCGYCGATLFVNSYVYNGHRKRRYNCPSTYKSKQKSKTYRVIDPNCPFKLVYAAPLEKKVLDEIKELALHPESIRHPAKRNETNIDVKAVKDQLTKIRKQQQRLVDLYVISESIDLDNISKKSADLKLQEEALKKQLTKATGDDVDSDKIVDFTKTLAKTKNIDELPYDKQKYIVRKLVKTIDVYNDDKIKIHWNL